MKPLVHYRSADVFGIGKSAYVNPIDHPSPWVSNTTVIMTTAVISHNKETGEFETENTRYIPAQRNQCDGCQAGLPLDANGHHYNPESAYRNAFACTKDRYQC